MRSRVTPAGRLRRRLHRLHAKSQASGPSAADLALPQVRDALAINRERLDAESARIALQIAWIAADFEIAGLAAEQLAIAPESTLADQALVAETKARTELVARASAPPAARREPPLHDRRVLHVLAFAPPHSGNGYAMRSQGLLTAIAAGGWEPRIFTRPGFPGDSDPRWLEETLAPYVDVGPLRYHRIAAPSRRRTTHMGYLKAAVDAFAALIARERPRLVHAASNYMTALPALIAAREAGLPFVYEVRGFWDLTRSSSDAVFAGSKEERHIRSLEAAVCRNSDRLITLNDAMRLELVSRGCDLRRIAVAPNGVAPTVPAPAHTMRALRARYGFTSGVAILGYIGSFVDYEGLDDLIEAAARLRDQGIVFGMLLVGDGLSMAAVQAAVGRHHLGEIVRLPGRIAVEDIPAHYALIDVCVYPRKPWPVCELVSPLKPVEAMSYGKALVVSSVAPLTEIVANDGTGIVFEKGDVDALVAALRRILTDPALRRRLASAAKEWVGANLTWESAARICSQVYLDAPTHLL